MSDLAELREAVAKLSRLVNSLEEKRPDLQPAGCEPLVACIIQSAADVTGLSRSDILSERREPQLVRARFAAIGVAKKLTDYSLPRLGRAFKRDHTTVMHALKRCHEIALEDAGFALTMYRIQARAKATIARRIQAEIVDA